MHMPGASASGIGSKFEIADGPSCANFRRLLRESAQSNFKKTLGPIMMSSILNLVAALTA